MRTAGESPATGCRGGDDGPGPAAQGAGRKRKRETMAKQRIGVDCPECGEQVLCAVDAEDYVDVLTECGCESGVDDPDAYYDRVTTRAAEQAAAMRDPYNFGAAYERARANGWED